MRRVRGLERVALMALCAFGAMVPPAAARSIAYDQKTIVDDEVTMAKVIMQDEKFRMEAVQEGTRTVAIRNNRGIFTYLPDERLAMKLPALETSQGGVIEDLNDYVGYVNQHNGKVISQETVNGKSCDVYQFVDPANGNATTAWVWTEQQFPLRLETDGPEGKIITEFLNIQFDVPVDPSMFEIPAGIEVVDPGEGLDTMPNLGGDLGL